MQHTVARNLCVVYPGTSKVEKSLKMPSRHPHAAQAVMVDLMALESRVLHQDTD